MSLPADLLELFPPGSGLDHDGTLRQAAQQMRATVDGLHRQMPDSVLGEPEEASAYGALLLQAQRLAGHLEASARQDSHTAHGHV